MLTTPARHILCAGVWLASALGYPASLQAAGLAISPVVVEVNSPRKSVAITVTNDSDRALTFQTDTMVWRQVNGLDQYEPTDELLVVPPIVEIAPNASQLFRVTLRVPVDSPVERTYRLILEDITEASAVAEEGSVAFKFVHNLPVMVAPAGKIVNALRWKPCALNTASTPLKPSAARTPQACVLVYNAGNRRVKIQTLTLTGDGWEQVLQLKAGENVLAGAEREWRVPLQPGQTGAVRGVQTQTARGETLQAEAGGF